jgi:hypothetical protein
MHEKIWSVSLKTYVKLLSAVISMYLHEVNKASVVCRISQNCCYTPVEAIACAIVEFVIYAVLTL